MAQNSGHVAPWLTSTQTEMFSDYAGRSSCLFMGAVASCFTHASEISKFVY